MKPDIDHTSLTTILDLRSKKLAKSNDGGDNGDMNAWQQSVENRLGQLHNDIVNSTQRLSDKIDHHLLYVIGGFVAVLMVLAKGFNWL